MLFLYWEIIFSLKSLEANRADLFSIFTQIQNQVSRIFSPGCSSVSIKWQQFDINAPKPMQAPAQIQSLFTNERLLVYGFVPHCTQVKTGIHTAGWKFTTKKIARCFVLYYVIYISFVWHAFSEEKDTLFNVQVTVLW